MPNPESLDLAERRLLERGADVQLIDGAWLPIRDGDPRAYALQQRHYSARPRPFVCGNRSKFAGPGEHAILLTADCAALFGWRKQQHRKDGQYGVECFIFRNESDVRSSDLIREADALAFSRWPGERHFTFVDPRKVASRNPGYCFLMAGWRRCGISAAGLLIFELEAPTSDDPTIGAQKEATRRVNA